MPHHFLPVVQLLHAFRSMSPTQTKPSFKLEAILSGFVANGVLTEEQVAEVRAGAAKRETALRAAMQKSGSTSRYVSPLEIVADFGFPPKVRGATSFDVDQACRAFAAINKFTYVRIDPLKLDAARLCSIVSKPFARSHLMAPVAIQGTRLTVAMVNPFDQEAVVQLEDVTGFQVVPVLGQRTEIIRTINEVFAFEHSMQKAQLAKTAGTDINNLEQLVNIKTDRELDASDQHVVKAVDLLFTYAFEQRASDIHIEPKRERAVVRLRIDGRLHDTHSIPQQVYPGFLSRIKIMARLDIAEKRKPQDGRIKTVFKDDEIELRVSTVPVAFGEKCVIRIFDPSVLLQSLESLGLFPDQLTVFERIVRRPHGILLVTGPTGSGKTTTLYSTLQYRAQPEVNVTTIEDPIEMVHESFNQIGVQESAGVTFAKALRSVLRQDPDIIMVGEIRDTETADYAVQAALTGHLVLSTLHTNTALGAIIRLGDLGVEEYLIASTLIGAVAQRLLRTVCESCAEPSPLSPEAMISLGIDGDIDSSGVRRGAGCEECRQTGYRGRIAVFDVVEMTDEVRLGIRSGHDPEMIAATANEGNRVSMLESGIRHMLAGRTTAEEILRVIPPD